jgi:hypothetical protein
VLQDAEQALLTGKIDTKKQQPQTTGQVVIPIEQSAPTDQPQNYGFWQLEYYQKYFDIDTTHLFEKMKSHALLLKPETTHLDLYGPFWIPTTVIFLTFVMSSISGSINAYLDGKAYEYDFRVLSWTVAIVYSYLGFVPLFLFLMGRYFGQPYTELATMIQVYGYGQTVWLPAVVALALVPLNIVKFGIALVCGMHGVILRVRLIELKHSSFKLFAVAAGEVIYCLMMLYYFFRNKANT